MCDTLWSLCQNLYFPRNLRIRSDKTKRHYRYALNSFGELLGHEPRTSDLTDDNIVTWLGSVVDSGRDPRTANSYKERLHALWTWLAKRGVLKHWPTAAALPVPERLPSAWTLDELRQIVDACRSTPGNIGTVPASRWWLAWHALQWNTGERFGAMMAATWSMIRGNSLIIPAEFRKGRRKDARYELWPETLAALESVRAGDKLFCWPYDVTTFWNRYKRLLERANLPATRYDKTQKIRRSVATYIALNGGDATAALLHSSDAVTRKHYLDYSICRRQPQDLLPRLE